MKGAATSALILQSRKIGPSGFRSFTASLCKSSRVRIVAASKPKLSAIGAKSTSGNTDLVTGCCRSLRKCSSAAIGTIVHQHYHYRQILSHYRLELSHRHQKAAVADDQHCGFVWSGLGDSERSTEAKADRGEVPDHLEAARIRSVQ